MRIARSMARWSDAVKEAQASRWLDGCGVLVCRLASGDQPIEVDGHPVTFWEFIDGRRGRPSDVRQLGDLVGRIHRLLHPAEFVLPRFNPLGRVAARIEDAPIPDVDRRVLTEMLDEIAAQLPRLDFPHAPTVIHGDAHVQNLMVPADGKPILIDLENVAIGHPEWDLAVTATEWQVAGFWTDEQYQEFVEGYGGFDVTSWSGFEVLRRAQAIKMTTWLMQNVNESQEIRDEYELRMRTIRDGEPLRCWTPF
ncbi:Ser/Thr protein kinase RdoA (MazF antagonist) [Pseudonocardia sediminis]|uniref:Ser/Thr protein kinase RdoA (MazF antagonist) n=1 Tax=Pseudonocardia sediminis TaxID=1397368 RepID=A0A4V6MEE4_PSEST|nr:aminoglycoside phosphotransferase family protein [Pseudonocardia sediminis]RZT89060.1 Ser/Thr protein kinase RdoA (MazF antagonist) [Pseudonocardia sediminis]